MPLKGLETGIFSLSEMDQNEMKMTGSEKDKDYDKPVCGSSSKSSVCM